MIKLRGRVWKFGKNIDTDRIISGRYVSGVDPTIYAKHVMEAADPGFACKITPGDIIVADTNFGCGSSRESAPLAIKHAGIAAVIATNFARTFYRNAINIALPILESEDAFEGTRDGEELEINTLQGVIRNISTGTEFTFEPFNEMVQQIMAKGGLEAFVADQLARRKGIQDE